jgi:hypothetical protein
LVDANILVILKPGILEDKCMNKRGVISMSPGRLCVIVTALLGAFMMALFLWPVKAMAGAYTLQEESYGTAGVYKVTAEVGGTGTIGITEVNNATVANEPTDKKPAIIMGAASPFEWKVAPCEFAGDTNAANTTVPYKYFRYTITEEQNINGAGGTHKKMSGFDGTYYIVRVDISKFFDAYQAGSVGRYLHFRQKNNKALMVVPFQPEKYRNSAAGETFASAGTQVGVLDLADKSVFVDDSTGVPYIDVIMYSSGLLVAGADTGSTTAQFQADFPLEMYVDNEGDYLPGVAFDATAASPDANKWPTYGDYYMTKYYTDEKKAAGQGYTNYTIKGSDIEISILDGPVNPNEGTQKFWSLAKAMGSPIFAERRPIKLICEVPILEGLSVEGRNLLLDVNSFDIQIANHNSTGAAGLTVANGSMELMDSFQTTGAELAVGNNASMVIKNGGKFIIADTCQLEIEYDAASTPAGETPATTLNSGVITIEAGGIIENRGIITIEGKEGKPIDPTAPVNRDMQEAVFNILPDGTLVNSGALVINGAFYNMGTIDNRGRYAETISSKDPDKGIYTYHKGIQIAWKDDVTQDGSSVGHIENGIKDNGDQGYTYNRNAKIINSGDIVLSPGYVGNYGIIDNTADGVIYMCPVSEAIIPLQLTYDPLTTEKRVQLGYTMPSSLINDAQATLNNAGRIVTANIEIVNNGRTGTITEAVHDEMVFSNDGTINNSGNIAVGEIVNFNQMTNTGSVVRSVVLSNSGSGEALFVDNSANKSTVVYNGYLTVEGDSNIWRFGAPRNFVVEPLYQTGNGGEIVGWRLYAESDHASQNEKYLVNVYQTPDGETVKTLELLANTPTEVRVDSLPKVNGNVIYGFAINQGEGATAIVNVTSDTTTDPAAVSGLVYNGKEQSLVSMAYNPAGTVEYRLGADGAWDSSKVPVAKDAGTYDVYYRLTGSSEITGPVSVTISPKPLTVAADDVATPVGAQLGTLNYVVSGIETGDDAAAAVTATLTTTADPQTAGTYPISFSECRVNNPNYSLDASRQIAGTYTVTAKELSVTAKDKYGVFVDATATQAYTGYNIEVTATPNDGATIYYSTTYELVGTEGKQPAEGDITAYYKTYGSTTLKNLPAVAGEHTVYYYVVLNSDESVAVKGQKKVYIDKAVQAAPDASKITTEVTSTRNTWDGIIKGLSPRTMEYRKIDGDGTYKIAYNAEEYVSPGVYLIRNAADENHFASADIVVTVGEGPYLTVSFDSGVDGIVYSPVNVSFGDLVPVPANPYVDGDEFLGWSIDGNIYDLRKPVTHSMTLVAKWRGRETSGCTHHTYVWTEVQGSETKDGEMTYICSNCGDVLYRVPVTAYYLFNKNTAEKIKNAKQGETVKVETALWISFHEMVLRAMADRPDVTLEVHYLDKGHKGAEKTFTIPKGTDTVKLLDKNGYAGFIYLDGLF